MLPEWGCALLFLAGNALCDLRERCIRLWYTGVFAGLGIYLGIRGGRSILEVLAAILPGCVLLLMSALSKGAVGMGDGIAVLVLGLFLNLWDVGGSCMFGFALSAIAGGVRFLLHRRGRDTLPFLPYLLLGCVLARWIWV